MTAIEQTQALIVSDTYRMHCLKAAQRLSLPDWYLAAGFLRNAIWDDLHGRANMTPLNDIDLVYFDPDDTKHSTEQAYQSQLTLECPDINWEVRNQARMHSNHGHHPYKDTEDAIAHWVEVPTCVGVRLDHNGNLIFCAPFGLDRNWSLRVDINPNHPQPNAFNQRINNKRWLKLWPKLIVETINA